MNTTSQVQSDEQISFREAVRLMEDSRCAISFDARTDNFCDVWQEPVNYAWVPGWVSSALASNGAWKI